MTVKKVRSGTIEIWSEDLGDPANPTVLLVMGASCGALTWDPWMIEPLVASGYHVIRFDNRDVGLSTWVDYEKAPYAVPDMAGDAIAVLNAFGVDRAHLLGVSMGGMIAQQVALDHSGRVHSLTSVMSSPGGPGLSLPTEAVQAVMETAQAASSADPLEALLPTFKALTGSRFVFDERAFRAQFQAEIDRGGINPAVAHDLAMENSPSRRERLRTLATPTLIIHGDEDPIFPLDHGKATADAIPDAKLIVLRGVGHELPERCAAEYMNPLFDHLKANS